MKFESKRGPMEKKNMFCTLKNLFLYLLIFHYPFSFALQIGFLQLEVAFP